MTICHTFTINIKDAELDDIKRRLESVRYTNEVSPQNDDMGLSVEYIKGLVEYWKNNYDRCCILTRKEEHTLCIRLLNVDYIPCAIGRGMVHAVIQRFNSPYSIDIGVARAAALMVLRHKRIIQ